MDRKAQNKRAQLNHDRLPKQDSVSKLSRLFVMTRLGHVHVVHNTFFDPSKTPIVCLHMSGHSGRSFQPLIKFMHGNRLYIAIDYPGCGDSDPPPPGIKLSIEDYAKITWDVIESLRLKTVNLLGHHTGSKIAVAMAVQNPGMVNKIILAATSISSTNSNVNRLASSGEPAMDKQYFRQLLDQLDQLESPSITQDIKAGIYKEALKAGQHLYDPQSAAQTYNDEYATALSSLHHHVTVINLNDELRLETPEIMRYMHNANLLERMEWGHGFLETAAEDVANTVELIVGPESDDHRIEARHPQKIPENYSNVSLAKCLFNENGRQLPVFAGQEFILQPLSSPRVYYFDCGKGYLFKNGRNGGRQITQLITQGSLFFSDKANQFHALSNGNLILLEQRELKDFLVENPALVDEVLDQLRKTISEVEYISSLVVSSTAIQSVAGFILYLAEKYEASVNQEFETNLTRFEMSEFLGVTFETVSRQLSKLKELGIIEVNRDRITICDKVALESESVMQR